MQLDSIEAVIRPRSAWEATDLGMLMARRWWWPTTRAWLTLTLPVYLALLFLPGESWVGPLVFWWLKPFWERIHLHIVSRALFGDVPSLRETCRAFPKLIGMRFVQTLLWGRLNGFRSMDAPVMQLEGLRGARYRQRLKLLHAEEDQPARTLLAGGATIETLLVLAFIALATMLVPAELSSTVGQALNNAEDDLSNFIENLLVYASFTLVAPFYVAGGFALYLNRRVKLEAWDIEIAFRKMAAARGRGRNSSLAKAALLLLACALPLTSENARTYAADAAPVEVLNPQTARDSIEAVMARPEFHEIETRPEPQLDPELVEKIAEWLRKVFEFFSVDDPPDAGRFFSMLIEVLLWTTLAGIVAILLFNYRHWLRAALFGQRAAAAAPSVTSHDPLARAVDLRDQTLPDDVAAACKALWQQGRALDAVALLYRASLLVFTRAHRVNFDSSSTEGEHLATVRATLPPATSAYFARLSRVWLFLAYGKRTPDESQLLALCDDWRRDWEEPVQRAGTGPEVSA